MKSILVTGGNRMGTSWMGKMLCLSDEAFLVWEPFNHLIPLPAFLPKTPLRNHFQRILPSQERGMKRFIRYRRSVHLIHSARTGSGMHGLIRTGFRTAGRFIRYLSGDLIPLYKDPIALMSAEWMAEEYNAEVVIMVRHPCAYINSVRRLGWRTPVEDFLCQEHLMAQLPNELQAEVRKRASERPMPEEGTFDLRDAAICWKVFHTVIDRYRTDHPDWLVIKHEDLCLDHLNAFRDVYEHLGLTWNSQVAMEIDSHCGSSNPIVQGNTIHVFHQDSASLAVAWSNSFSDRELGTIRHITSPVWERFYGEESWPD